MIYSPRTFLFGPDDTLFRLATAKFSRVVDVPKHQRLERFAEQGVRMVEAILEILERTPCAVVRLVCQTLGFHARGPLDRRAFERVDLALMDLQVDRGVRCSA